jgi:methionyl-tRNA synthetase
LGNLIGCVLSGDVYARFCRLLGKNTLYICGTDEYGTATEIKAKELGLTPRELCDEYHAKHKAIYDWFDIDFDYFGRTCTDIHSEITKEIFGKLKENKLINKDYVDQFKCTTCDIFLADRLIVGKCYHPNCNGEARGDQCDKCGNLCNALELINPKCKSCGTSPTLTKSCHYFLDLTSGTKNLQDWIDKSSVEGSWSENTKSITKSFLDGGLKQRCITRDLNWGVDVPSDGEEEMNNKVFYVWFDAPIGYISITANFIKDRWAEWWKNPDNVKLFQFMGKDNVTFHSIIFPSTLLGTGDKYTLVHHFATTEYLNYENSKFSKGNQTGVFGDDAQNTGIPSEVWRYYLLACRPEQSDAEFGWGDFRAKNNNELLANLGNLVNRVLIFISNNFSGIVPKTHKLADEDYIYIHEFADIASEYINCLEGYDKERTFSGLRIKEGLRTFMELSSLANGYLTNNAPWVLMKTDKDR